MQENKKEITFLCKKTEDKNLHILPKWQVLSFQ